MQAVTNAQIEVVCNAALNRYRKPIIVDMTGRKVLAHSVGRTCVKVTPPTAVKPGENALFKLEKFLNGTLSETVMLAAVNGRYFVVQA